MAETQPGREPEQGAGPDNESQGESGIGYADPGAQSSLGSREPTEDLRPTGYLDPGAQSSLGSREPTGDLHEEPGSAETPRT